MGTSYPLALDTFPNAATLASHNFNTDPHSTLHGNLGDAVEAIESWVGTAGATSYTPAWQGSGITSHSATWSGKYYRIGSLGFVAIDGAISGTWTGSGYIELGLPSGWTAISGFSGNGVMGAGVAFAEPSSNPFGLHYVMTPIIHDGGTGVRFVQGAKTTISGNDVKAFTELACDGVTSGPFNAAFASGDKLHTAFMVLLA